MEALKYLQQDPNRDLTGALARTFTYIKENGLIGVDSFVEAILEVHQGLGTTGQGAWRQRQFVQAVGLENLQELVVNGAINGAHVVEGMAALELGLPGGSSLVVPELIKALIAQFPNQADLLSELPPPEAVQNILPYIKALKTDVVEFLVHTGITSSPRYQNLVQYLLSQNIFSGEDFVPQRLFLSKSDRQFLHPLAPSINLTPDQSDIVRIFTGGFNPKAQLTLLLGLRHIHGQQDLDADFLVDQLLDELENPTLDPAQHQIYQQQVQNFLNAAPDLVASASPFNRLKLATYLGFNFETAIWRVLTAGLPPRLSNLPITPQSYALVLEYLQQNSELRATLPRRAAVIFDVIESGAVNPDVFAQGVTTVLQGTQKQLLITSLGESNLNLLGSMIHNPGIQADFDQAYSPAGPGGSSDDTLSFLPRTPSYLLRYSTPKQFILQLRNELGLPLPGLEIVIDRDSYQAALEEGQIDDETLQSQINQLTTRLSPETSQGEFRSTQSYLSLLNRWADAEPVQIVLRPDRNFAHSTASYLSPTGAQAPRVVIVLGTGGLNQLKSAQWGDILDRFFAFAAQRVSQPDRPELPRVMGLDFSDSQVALVAQPFDTEGFSETLADVGDIRESLDEMGIPERSEVNSALDDIETDLEELELPEHHPINESFEELQAQFEALPLPTSGDLDNIEASAATLEEQLAVLPDVPDEEEQVAFNDNVEELEESLQELGNFDPVEFQQAKKAQDDFASELEQLSDSQDAESLADLQERWLELRLPDVPGGGTTNTESLADLETRSSLSQLPEPPGVRSGTTHPRSISTLERQLKALQEKTASPELVPSGQEPTTSSETWGQFRESRSRTNPTNTQGASDEVTALHRQNVTKFLEDVQEATGLDIDTGVSSTTTNQELESQRSRATRLVEEQLDEIRAGRSPEEGPVGDIDPRTQKLMDLQRQGTNLGVDFHFFGLDPDGTAPTTVDLDTPISEAEWAESAINQVVEYLKLVSHQKTLNLPLENPQELSELELQQMLNDSLAQIGDPNIPDAEIPNRGELLATGERARLNFQGSEMIQRRLRLQEFLAHEEDSTTSTSTLEQLQDRLTNLKKKTGEEVPEAVAAEQVEELLTPVVAGAAISDDLSTLEAEVKKRAAEETATTGVEHTVDPASIDISPEGHVNFDIVNTETGEKVSHFLNTDDLDFQLPKFLEKGHQKLQELETGRESLPTAKPGETPRVTAQTVSHFTTAGGLVLGGAVLARSIRQLEDGNDSPEAKAGVALGSYFTLHAAYGGYKQFLAPVIARKFGSQVERFSAAAEKTAVN